VTTCLMCEQDPRCKFHTPLPAVTTIISINGHDVRNAPVCRHHLTEWQRWRRLVYGGAEPRIGQPERTASGTDA